MQQPVMQHGYYYVIKIKLGLILYKCIWDTILTSLCHTNTMQLKCKNKKLQNLVASKPSKLDSYKKPVIQSLIYSLKN